MTVLVPWRDPGCEWRARAKDWLAVHYRPIGPVVYADDGADPFSRSGSRNLAAAQTTDDVLVFLDADAWVPLPQVEAAVETARESGRLVRPFTDAGFLTQAATERVYEVGAVEDPEFAHPPVRGFIGLGWVIRRDVFDRLDGFDTGFVGYGGEDNAFVAACDTLLGPTILTPGRAASLWHPGDRVAAPAVHKRVAAYYQIRSWADYRRLRRAP